MRPDDFKAAMGSWATGVSVVTTNQAGMLYGLTVSSLTSVSLDPPLVLVCLNQSNRMGLMIVESTRFAVSLLADDQAPASNYFAKPGREPTPGFVEIDGEWTDYDVPVVKNALSYMVCEHHQTIAMGDHAVVFGRVISAVSRDDGRGPLMYWRRGYREIAGVRQENSV